MNVRVQTRVYLVYTCTCTSYMFVNFKYNMWPHIQSCIFKAEEIRVAQSISLIPA